MKMKGFILIVLSAILLSWTTAVLSKSSQGEAGLPELSIELIADGFEDPTDIANAGDDRLFIVERAGKIRIIDRDQTIVSVPFLDIDSQVDSLSHSERGLLGLVFHPQFPDKPYFYVNYTQNNGNTIVSRFTVNPDQTSADQNSEVILLNIAQPAGNHNGGDLNFGPDGYLYIATGDGGGGGDPWGTVGNGQETQTLLGKILRIDVDNGAPYAIPADNPFVNEPNTLDEIWALGLRNPWRFSFDQETNDLYIADVGQNAWEEINFASAASSGGENYGWRCYEGNSAFNLSNCSDMGNYIFPIDVYPHSNSSSDDEGFSVTGGFVYRGPTHPDLQGYYVYADFVSGNVWLAINSGSGWQITPYGQVSGLNKISTFGEGCDRELYVADYDGQIHQIKTAVIAPPAPLPGPYTLYLPLVFPGASPAFYCTS